MTWISLVFVIASLLIGGAVYTLVTASIPMNVYQGAGAGGAFMLGWIGYAFAGSAIVRGMRERRPARGVRPLPS